MTLLAVLTAFSVYAAADGSDIFYKKCTGCHGSALSLNNKKNESQWASTIKRMEKHGLSISSSETKAVAKFLSGGN